MGRATFPHVVNRASWVIVRALADRSPQTSTELRRATALTRPVLQRRLHELWGVNVVDADLGVDDWPGRTVHWSLNADRWNALLESMTITPSDQRH